MLKNLFLILIFLTSCKNPEQSIQEEKLILPESLSEFTKPQIAEIYKSIKLQNWNTGNHLGRQPKDYYFETAKKYDLNVLKVEQIESYYNNEVIPFLTTKIKDYYKNNKNLELDYYSPIYPTAYCGLNTLKGKLVVYGNEKDSYENSKLLAKKISENLPDYVTGYKLNEVIFKDTILGIAKDLEIGFLYRKINPIKIMKKSIGTYGFTESKRNYHWHTDEWNDETEAK